MPRIWRERSLRIPKGLFHWFYSIWDPLRGRKAYAALAVVFSEYRSVSWVSNEVQILPSAYWVLIISTRADSSGSAAPWSYHKYHHISGNRCKSTQIVGPDDLLVRAASGLLPVILSKCVNDPALVNALQENALQLKSTDKLHDKKLEAAIASLEYLKVSLFPDAF